MFGLQHMDVVFKLKDVWLNHQCETVDSTILQKWIPCKKCGSLKSVFHILSSLQWSKIVRTTFHYVKCYLKYFIQIFRPFFTYWILLRITPFTWLRRRAYARCDRSAGDTYATEVSRVSILPYSQFYFFFKIYLIDCCSLSSLFHSCRENLHSSTLVTFTPVI